VSVVSYQFPTHIRCDLTILTWNAAYLRAI
jgi:hypothetical protein